MTPHDEAVEAACRAGWNDAWNELDDASQREELRIMNFDITAYLRHMRAAGFAVTRVPDARSPDGSTAERYALDISWNACRAEMLANAVEVPDDRDV